MLRKVRDEINNFHKPVIGVEDIKQFTYLECAVKEMLRMYPTVFMVDREATEEIKLGPHTLPKGVSTAGHTSRHHAIVELTLLRSKS